MFILYNFDMSEYFIPENIENQSKSLSDEIFAEINSIYTTELKELEKMVNGKKPYDEFINEVCKEPWIEKFFIWKMNDFLDEYNKWNNETYKKVNEIKKKLNISSNDPKIIIIQALENLSLQSKYQEINKYLNENSDIWFVKAYWFIQYTNWITTNIYWVDAYDWSLNIKTLNFILNELKIISFDDARKISDKDPKKNQNEKLDWDNDNKWNLVPDEWSPEIFNSDVLSQYLSNEYLDGITYDDVIDMINWIEDTALKNEIVKCLMNNDIIWAQSLLWMEINCPSMYPDYVAWKKIWQRELRLMERYTTEWRYWKYRLYMNENDIMESDIPDDVKESYQKFRSWEFDNKWMPYAIISKYCYNIYMFSADHILLAKQPVITWATVWDRRNDTKKGINTTPSWLYTISNIKLENKDFYWSHCIHIYPENWLNPIWNYELAIHWDKQLNKPEDYEKNRSKARRQSHGCIRTQNNLFWEIYNILKTWAKVYITNWDEIDDV